MSVTLLLAQVRHATGISSDFALYAVDKSFCLRGGI